MTIPDKLKTKKRFTCNLHVRLDEKTAGKLFTAYESYFKAVFPTFSAYLRSIIEEYSRSPYFAKILH